MNDNQNNEYQKEKAWILANPGNSTLELMRGYAEHNQKQSINDFEQLVFKARQAQQSFYKAKPNTEARRHYLQKSKLLESQIDAYFDAKQNPKLEI